MSAEANHKETTVEENINNTIASGSCVVEFKKSDGSKPLTAQFTLPGEVGGRHLNCNYDDRASTKYRRTATNVGGIDENPSNLVSEAVFSEYNDAKMYEHIQVTEESQSGKSDEEAEKIVVTNMSSCQSSAREQYPKITRPMMK